MTEAYEDGWLVRVRAQVMCRDEGTGGWVALGGGGLANVMVGKRLRPAGAEATSRLPHAPSYEYYIYGVRISDSEEVLACTIKKDFQYNKVMPTFHHWVTDEKRFGLTFQTAADARAFDRGVRSAVQELLDGLGGAWPSLHAYKKHNPAPREDDEENNIFECLNLPTESRSSSENSTASRPRRRHTDDDITQTPILSTITLPRQTSPEGDMARRQYAMTLDESRSDVVEIGGGSDCPYIQLSALHVYTYPSRNAGLDMAPKDQTAVVRRDFAPIFNEPPPLPDKKFTRTLESLQGRIKCKYCDEWYIESANRAGSCKFAPDCCKSCINTVTCIKCAQCMVYHCMSESEGDFALRPCSCTPADNNCTKRWLCVALMSILVPCLCCYGPLRWGHRAARSLNLAGGHHAPVDRA